MTIDDGMRMSVEPVELLAAELLDGVGTRLLHTRGVAGRAEALAAGFADEDARVLVVSAWWHDVGYSPALAETGFHPIDGAHHALRCGLGERVAALVAHHSGARFEAAARGLGDQLARFRREVSAVDDALVAADLTTSPTGQPVTFDERIEEILARYGPDHVVHRVVSRSQHALRPQVERAYERAGLAP